MKRFLLLLLAAGFLCTSPVMAQNLGLPDFDSLEEGEGDVLIRSDQQEFDQRRNVVIFNGNVRVEHNNQIITADQIALDRETNEAYGSGNVKITDQAGRSWTFDELTWNLDEGADVGQRSQPRAIANKPASEARPEDLPVGVTPTPQPDAQPLPDPRTAQPGRGPDLSDPNWRGSGIGNTPNPELFFPPFYITAKEGRAIDRGHIFLKDALVTTCPFDKLSGEMPEFYMIADELDVYDGEIVVATRPRFYVNDVKIFSRPKYTLDLKREASNLDLLPGISNRDGVTLQSAYTWFPAETWSTTTHLDLRSKRGIAVGQDFEWREFIPQSDKDAALAQAGPLGEFSPAYAEPRPSWQGKLEGYFALDQEPYRSDAQEVRQREQGLDIDEERYRLRLSHYHNITDQDYLYVEGNLWSDEEITRDFFSREFRLMPTPENRIALVHYDQNYSLGLEINNQFNTDDFSNINRLPEVTFSSFQLPLGESGFYYDTDNSAGLYESRFNDRLTDAGFSEFETERAHTSHTLSYPLKYAGWLNLIPRASYSGTWYGDTIGTTETIENVSVSTDALGNETSTTNFTDVINGGGSDFRNLFEGSLEASFKGFRVLHEDMTSLDSKGLRHVFEPYATYTISNEPDLRPTDLFQFDLIDRLDQRNDIVFGIRNKLQTKRIRPGVTNADGSPETYVQDIIDINVSAAYEIDPDETTADPNPDNLSDVFIDTEWRARDWMRLDSRVNYDPGEGEVTRSENTVVFTSEESDFVSLSHIFRPDIFNTVQASYGLWPQRRYSVYGVTRYAFEEGLLEEQGLLLTYKTDCIGYGIGGSYISGDFISDSLGNEEDDWKVYAQMWLLAFPGSELSLGF